MSARRIADQLADLRARSLLRGLREIETPQRPLVRCEGRELINFSSNDYLGLAADSLLAEAAIDAIREFGVGSGASRLVCGTQPPHTRLERALAEWKQTDAALAFPSGYAAALGTLGALAGPHDVLILDKLCHASLIDGARLSGAILRVFPHNHIGRLESQLAWARDRHPEARVIVVTESVFSMDGDLAPLRDIVELKKTHRAMLLLDEAHAIGVLGGNGRGLAHDLGLSREIDIQLGTLSKALGVSGGYVCGSQPLIDLLINRARSLIYTTAPPPSLAAAATAAVGHLASPAGEERRALLWRNIRHFIADAPPAFPRAALTRSAIAPLIIGGEQEALDAARWLRARGFLLPAIRFPTVPRGTARLRVTLSASHTPDQIAALCAALVRLPGVAS